MTMFEEGGGFPIFKTSDTERPKRQRDAASKAQQEEEDKRRGLAAQKKEEEEEKARRTELRRGEQRRQAAERRAKAVKAKKPTETDAEIEARRKVVEAAAVKQAEQREQRELAEIRRTESAAAAKRTEDARRAEAARKAAARQAEAERLKLKGRPEDIGATVAVGGEAEGRREATETERELERIRTENVVIASLVTSSNAEAARTEERLETESRESQSLLEKRSQDEQQSINKLAAKQKGEGDKRLESLAADQKTAQSQIDEFIKNLEFRAQTVATPSQIKEFNNQTRIAEKEIAIIVADFNKRVEAANEADTKARSSLESALAVSQAKLAGLNKSEIEKLESLFASEQSRIDSKFQTIRGRADDLNKASVKAAETISTAAPIEPRLETQAEALARFIKQNPDLKGQFNETNRKFSVFAKESDRLRFDAIVARDIARSQQREAEILAQAGVPAEVIAEITKDAARLETQAEALARFVKNNPDLKGEFNEANRKFKVFTRDFDELTDALQKARAGAPLVLINEEGLIVKGRPPATALPEPSEALSPAEFNQFKNRLNRVLKTLRSENSLAFEADGSFALTEKQAAEVFTVIDKGVELGDDLSAKLTHPMAIPTGPGIKGITEARLITVSPGKSIAHAGELAEKWLEKNAGSGGAKAFSIAAKPEGFASLVLIVLATGQTALLARSGGRVVIRGLGTTAAAAKSSENAVRSLITAGRVLGPSRLALAPVSPFFSVRTVSESAKIGPAILKSGSGAVITPTKPLLSPGDLSKVFRQINKSFPPVREASKVGREAIVQIRREIATNLRAAEKASRGAVRAKPGSKALIEAQSRPFDFVGINEPGFATRLAQSRSARLSAIQDAKARQKVISDAITEARAQTAVISADPALAATRALDLQLATVQVLRLAQERNLEELAALEIGTAKALSDLATDPAVATQLRVATELEQLQALQAELTPTAVPVAVPVATPVPEPIAVPTTTRLPVKVKIPQPLAVPKTLKLAEIEVLKRGLDFKSPALSPALQTVKARVAELKPVSSLKLRGITRLEDLPVRLKVPAPAPVKVPVKPKAPVKVKVPEPPKKPPKKPRPPKPKPVPPAPKPPKPPKPKPPPPPKLPPKEPAVKKRGRVRLPRVGGIVSQKLLKLPRGVHPRKLQWRQGKFFKQIDLQIGRTTTTRNAISGGVEPGTKPRETLKIIGFQERPAKKRKFDIGAFIGFVEGRKRITFTRAKRNTFT